jgi:hypothetical protein
MRQCLRAGGVVLCVAVLVLALVTVGRPAPMPMSTTGTVLPHTGASGSSGNYFKQEIDDLNKPGGLDVGGEACGRNGCYATRKICRVSGTPFSVCTPRSTNESPEPATMSCTVCETKISPPCARAAILAAT